MLRCVEEKAEAEFWQHRFDSNMTSKEFLYRFYFLFPRRLVRSITLPLVRFFQLKFLIKECKMELSSYNEYY